MYAFLFFYFVLCVAVMATYLEASLRICLFIAEWNRAVLQKKRGIGVWGEGLVNLISDLWVKKIIYVSCNPSTLARDIKSFHEKGYKVDLIQPVDMFPHMEHTETVVLIKKM